MQEKQPPLPEGYSAELKELAAQMLCKAPDARPSLPEIFRLQCAARRKLCGGPCAVPLSSVVDRTL